MAQVGIIVSIRTALGLLFLFSVAFKLSIGAPSPSPAFFLEDEPGEIGPGVRSISDRGYTISYFDRDASVADVDVFQSGPFPIGKEVSVLIFPTWILFDEVYDVGTVTIEVLDAEGIVQPSTERTPSNESVAVAYVEYTVNTSGVVYYRLTSQSGFHFGEYFIYDADGDDELSGGVLTRILQDRVNIDDFPPINMLEFYQFVDGPENLFDRYIEYSIPSSITIPKPNNTALRLGFFALQSENATFTVTLSGSIQTELQYYLFEGFGKLLSTENVTVDAGGTATFQLSVQENNGYILVLRVDSGTITTVASSWPDPSIATYSCLAKDGLCPGGEMKLAGFTPDELVLVEIETQGDFGATSERVTIAEASTGNDLVSYRGQECEAQLFKSGSFYVLSDSVGEVTLTARFTAAVNFCTINALLLLRGTSLTATEEIQEIIKQNASAAASFCRGDTCVNGALNFAGDASLALNLESIMLTFMNLEGRVLVLSTDGNTFYNQTINAGCSQVTSETRVVVSLSSLPRGFQFPLSIDYVLEDGASCSGRGQGFVLGVLSYVSSSGPSDGDGDDDDGVALAAGLGTTAVLLLAALGFLYYYRLQTPPPVSSESKLATTA